MSTGIEGTEKLRCYCGSELSGHLFNQIIMIKQVL